VTQMISAGIIQSTKEIMKPPSSPQVLLDNCLLFRAEGWHFGAEIEKTASSCRIASVNYAKAGFVGES
jgi:hypothetical protein